MRINISFLLLLTKRLQHPAYQKILIVLSILLGLSASTFSFFHGYIVSYGDAESHLNIAKRVVSSITPGMAQLGGIWPPLPHLLMVPFVAFDALWRTGIAGSIVSGICFLVTVIYLYKFTFQVTKNQLASFIASLVFMLNPNILYMQSTPMTELPLIAFFMLSSYYFMRYLQNTKEFLSLIFAAFFAFCASAA